MTTNGRDGFGRSLIAHLPALRRYATALSGSTASADDLVQDCIERALRRSETLAEPQRIGGWLRSILHHLYLDDLRRNRRRGTGIELSTVENDIALSTPPNDGSAARDFQSAVAELSVEHRQVLLLVGVEGLNYREVAEELDIPIGTVMSRLARARERMRQTLADGAHAPASPPPLSQSGSRVRP